VSLAKDSGEERIVDLREPSQSIKPRFLNLFREERILRAPSMRTLILLSIPGVYRQTPSPPKRSTSKTQGYVAINSYREAHSNADIGEPGKEDVTSVPR